jgi:hypothetical protein
MKNKNKPIGLKLFQKFTITSLKGKERASLMTKEHCLYKRMYHPISKDN